MALTQCPDCENGISTNAAAGPDCGRRIASGIDGSSIKNGGIFMMVIGTILGIVVAGYEPDFDTSMSTLTFVSYLSAMVPILLAGGLMLVILRYGMGNDTQS